MFKDLMRNESRIRWDSLRTHLAIAPKAPAEFVYRLMETPGIMSNLAGEVVRIAKYIPVDVVTKKTDICYQELPLD